MPLLEFIARHNTSAEPNPCLTLRTGFGLDTARLGIRAHCERMVASRQKTNMDSSSIYINIYFIHIQT